MTIDANPKHDVLLDKFVSDEYVIYSGKRTRISMHDYYSENANQFAYLYEKLSAEVTNKSWSYLLPSTSSLILDIGAGSGRDAAWLSSMGHEIVATDPAKALLQKAQILHKEPSIQWIEDQLPELKKVARLGYQYDIILLNAVWMHIAPNDRERSFRKMVSLLRPGGKLVITLRFGPSPDKRIMHSVTSAELYELAKKFALDVILDTASNDQFGRNKVKWKTLVLWLPDDGTGALPLLRHVIINDPKSSTYKLALLRVLTRIADGAQGAVLKRDKKFVTLPFGLVALYWVKAFKDLILDNDFKQQPSENGKPGFCTEAFESLSSISPFDLRVGACFAGQTARNLIIALRDSRNIIKRMPASHTTYPNSLDPVFPCETKKILPKNNIKLDHQELARFGTFQVPVSLWEAMTRYACWLDPAIINQWSSLMSNYDRKIGRKVPLEDYQNALSWLDSGHDTIRVRSIVENLRTKGKSIYCVWSGINLKHDFEIDHCFPFAHWPNNDLWNLMPSHPKVNRKKLNRLPSAALLEKAKDKILYWWEEAYYPNNISDQFIDEALYALPIRNQPEATIKFDAVFTGIREQRRRLKLFQQIAEWSG